MDSCNVLKIQIPIDNITKDEQKNNFFKPILNILYNNETKQKILKEMHLYFSDNEREESETNFIHQARIEKYEEK